MKSQHWTWFVNLIVLNSKGIDITDLYTAVRIQFKLLKLLSFKPIQFNANIWHIEDAEGSVIVCRLRSKIMTTQEYDHSDSSGRYFTSAVSAIGNGQDIIFFSLCKSNRIYLRQLIPRNKAH